MHRRKTRSVNIGGVPLGSEHPVRVQSMTNLPTSDIDGQVEQIRRIVDAGGEYVRITVPTMKDVEYFAEIKRRIREEKGTSEGSRLKAQGSGYDVPLIADVHFSPKIAIAAAKVADKVRINPGNFVKVQDTDTGSSPLDPRFRGSLPRTRSGDDTHADENNKVPEPVEGQPATRNLQPVTWNLEPATFPPELHEAMLPLLNTCKEYGTALRIGTNHGSLSERIMEQYGDTPLGMVEATLEAVRVCMREDFHDIVLSLKSSNVRVMIEATRLLVQKMEEESMDYPLHLGVTEAGDGEDGRIKSAIGIGSLLADGLGDTIRVSLTEEPENEIPVAYHILQASRARITKTDYIACPGCGRTTFKLQEGLSKVREATKHLTGLKIAVMGCIVNGPGEMADADYGYVGAGPGLVSLYKGKELVKKNIPEDQAIEELLKIIGHKALG